MANFESMPLAPGDTIRDKKSSHEYVVDFVAGGLAGGLITFGAFRLFDRNFQHFTTDEVYNDFTYVKDGKGQTATDVLDQFDVRIAEFFENDKEVVENLMKDPKNVDLRSLFFLSTEDLTGSFTQRVIDVAETVAGMTGGTISYDDARNIIMEFTGTNLTAKDEAAVDETAKILAEASRKSFKKRNNIFDISTSTVQDLLLGRGKKPGTATIMTAFGGREVEQVQSSFLRNLIFETNTTKSFMDSELGKELPRNFYKLTAPQKLEALTNIMIRKEGGKYSPEVVKKFIKSQAQQAADKMVDQRETLLTRALAAYFHNPAEYSRTINKVAFQDVARRSGGSRTTYLSRYYNYVSDTFKGPRTLNTKVANARWKGSLGIDWHKLVTSSSATHLSLTPSAFYDLIGNSKLTYGSLKDKAVRESIDKHIDKGMVLPIDMVRSIFNKSNDATVDIDQLLDISRESMGVIKNSSESLAHLNKLQDSQLNPQHVVPIKLNNNLSSINRSQNMLNKVNRLMPKPSQDSTRYFMHSDLNENIYGSTLLEVVNQMKLQDSTEPIDLILKKISFFETKQSLDESKIGITLGKLIPIKLFDQIGAIGWLEDSIEPVEFLDESADSIKEIYDNAVQEGRMMVANIKGKKQVMGTDLATDIQTQIQRGTDFLNRGGFILDIETVGLSNKKAVDFNLSRFDSNLTEQKFIDVQMGPNEYTTRIGTIKRIIEDIQSSDLMVTTKGKFDFEEIIEELTGMIKQASEGRLNYDLQELYSLRGKALDISRTRLFDTEVFLQTAGQSAGSLSQNFLSLKYLGKSEQHTAREDVLDLADIYKKLRDEFEPVDLEEVKDTIFFRSSKRANNSGEFLRYAGSRITPTDQGNKTIAMFERLAIENNRLVDTGEYVAEAYDTNYALSASLTKYSEIMPGREINTETIELARKLKAEQVGRSIRSLNPLNRTIADPLEQYGYKELAQNGTYGRFEFKIIGTIGDHLQALTEVANNASNQTTIAEGRSLTLNEYEANLTARAEAIRGYIAEKGLGEYNGVENSTVVDYLNYYANQAVNDSKFRQAYLEDSPYTKLQKSKFGQALKTAGQHEFNLLYNEATRIAAGSAAIENTDPRLRLEYTDQGQALMKSTTHYIDDGSISRIRTTLMELSNQAAVTLDFEESGSRVLKTLEGLGYGQSQIEDLQQLAKKYRQNANIPEFKQKIQTLGLDDDPEFKDLRGAAAKLNRELSKDVIIEDIDRRVAKLSERTLLTEERKVEVSQFAQQLKDDISSIDKNDSMGVGNRIEEVFGKYYSVNELDTESARDRVTVTKQLMNDLFSEERLGVSLVDLTEEETSTAMKLATQKKKELERFLSDETDDALAIINEDLAFFHNNRRGQDLAPVDYHSFNAKYVDDLLDQLRAGNDFMVARRDLGVGPFDPAVVSSIANKAAMITAGDSSIPSTVRETQHAAVLSSGINKSIAANFKKLSVPLMAIGAGIALLSASSPGQPKFSQGNVSDSISPIGAELNTSLAVAKNSEIPGYGDNRTWIGEPGPFQIDISFRGFVDDKRQTEILKREVYNVLTNRMEVKNTRGEIQDRRRPTSEMSYDLMKERI